MLSVVEGVLNKALRRQADQPDKYARQKLDDLMDALKGDGFAYWVFTDGRFHLMESDDAFLRFLCEMVHPVVRPDAQEVVELVRLFNDHLVADGWEIYPSTEISKRPVFSARRITPDGFASVRQAKAIAEKVDATYIARLITRMEGSFERDPELAIGTAKELIESVCKTILDDRGVKYSKGVTLPELSKATFKQLKLVPEDVPEQMKGSDLIRRILGSLGTVSQGLAELRGLYGAGHGKHGKTKGLNPRHAKLAVGASSTLAVFLYETHLQNQEEAKTKAGTQ